MELTPIEQSLLLATYFRCGSREQRGWTANTSQILTLSLFYTGEICRNDCIARFSNRPYLSRVYDAAGEVAPEIEARYNALLDLLRKRPDLLESNGINFDQPAEPPYTACRLTPDGLRLAVTIAPVFPSKPDFPTWPDQRALPG
jgi:hypothetical protein